MSDWVGRSTATPKRVCPWLPPASRSSPLTAGPSLTRWTWIAIHDPIRALPLSRMWASIVSPSAAPTGATAGPTAASNSANAASARQVRRAPECDRGCARRRRTKAPGGGLDGSGRSMDAWASPKVARSPALARRLSYDAGVPRAAGRVPHPEGPVPEIRPFRALRYNPATIADPAAGGRPAVRRGRRAASRSACWHGTPRMSSVSTCPASSRATRRMIDTGGPPGRSRHGALTGRCTRTRTPRSTSTSRIYRVPGTDVSRTQRGFFARLRLEALRRRVRACCPTSGRWPGPREDRYKLLRATGVNTSPVVGLYDDPDGRRRRGHRRRHAPGRRRRPRGR